MISAEIICDSINPSGVRLTTAIMRYPRFIHSELMTHRNFSRNAASSRAIPVGKMLDAVLNDPAMPVAWGRNQAGMQAAEPLNDVDIADCKYTWLKARDKAVNSVKILNSAGLHKQIANRLLEPWAWMTCLVSGTDWDNFFKLRVHKDAQPEFQVLAYKMLCAYLDNEPKRLNVGSWHLPFGDRYFEPNTNIADKLKACVGRCARVSYLNQDGQYSIADDIKLHDRLIGQEPGHWTPAEHIASARLDDGYGVERSNFRGWTQYRKLFANENHEYVDLHALRKSYEASKVV